MVGMGWTRVALVGLAVAALGCDSIPLRTADTHSEVISTRREVVRSDAVRVQSRVDNTLLVIRARQGCDLVEKNRVQLTEII